jgi:diguanylate cyclase (GGDEF)-like protein
LNSPYKECFIVREKAMENFLDQQHFVMELESQQKLVRRANGFSVLVLIDLDSFDNIKDQYGDLVAAMAIKNFSSFLDSSLRRSDICSHYGGKTFAIVMPATNAVQAEKKD